MILYLDTSSIVKLYVEEKGSRLVRGLVERADLVATSVVTYAEARAALARQRREGGLTAAGFSEAKAALDWDWPRYLAVEVNEPVYRGAGDMAEKHRLRGFDSLHLASYLFLRREGDREIRFSSFDRVLNAAARKETKKR